jgi:hypothetical protein
MSKAKEPVQGLTFADEVDKLVHDELNNGIPVGSVRAKPDATKLASAIALLHELLTHHRQELTPEMNSAWLAAGSLLDDLRTGLHGPIWRYIDDVRTTRREAHKAAAGGAAEASYAAVIGLIDAYRSRTGKRKVTHLIIDAFTKAGWEFNTNQINGWRDKFAKTPDGEHAKTMPEFFKTKFVSFEPEDMLTRGVELILLVASRGP